MTKIWVLGAGQLGAMLHYSGLPLALDVEPVDIESATLLEIGENDFITAEREQWPDSIATEQLASHPNFINVSVFSRLADRLSQKQILDELGIATAPWCALEKHSNAADLRARLGEPVLLKRRTGGYDGRGQHWLSPKTGDQIPPGWADQAIAEQRVTFDDEVSVIGVRNRQGEMVFYPLSLNLHLNGILMGTLAPVLRINSLQTQAESMLGKLMASLDYVGVMAMECFRVGDNIMVNEVAPRVHNSGHWTLTGASINQFEYHLRAVVDLPIPPAVVKGPTAMVNLIGTEYRREWLAIKGAELYWYNKEVRPGRKVGHINFTNPNLAELRTSLESLKAQLPENYVAVIDWLCLNLD